MSRSQVYVSGTDGWRPIGTIGETVRITSWQAGEETPLIPDRVLACPVTVTVAGPVNYQLIDIVRRACGLWQMAYVHPRPLLINGHEYHRRTRARRKNR